MSGPRSLRRRLGALVHDVPRYAWALRPDWLGAGTAWVGVRNRHETLERAPDGSGVACRWRWTSDLTGAAAWPGLGRLLLRRALGTWPVALAADRPTCDAPALSVVVGHRGEERLALLLATLGSLATQEESALECIVVEQSERSELTGRLPSWVRHVHTPPPDGAMPYARAWAFNVGAREARGAVLAFHDGDLLVPRAFAAEVLARARAGFEVIDLKRFVFYLDSEATRRILEARAVPADAVPESILQNSPGGGSLAVTREAFEAVGGFDESFVGWGGEDNELWERLATRRVYAYGHLPLLHLWHAPQLERATSAEPPMVRRYHDLARRSPEGRIEQLRARPRGDRSGPHPAWAPPA